MHMQSTAIIKKQMKRRTNMMHLNGEEGVVEAVTSAEMTGEVEVIISTIKVSKKTHDELSMLPGGRHKTASPTMNHTLSLKVKLRTSRMMAELMVFLDLMEITLRQGKSMTTLVMKSSNGMRLQIIRKTKLLKTMVLTVVAPPLRALGTSQEEIIKFQESTTQWAQQQTTSRLLAK
jgi:hypothetical protein